MAVFVCLWIFCCADTSPTHPLPRHPEIHTHKKGRQQHICSSPPYSLSVRKPINTSSYRFFVMSSVRNTANNTEINTIPSVNNIPAVDEPQSNNEVVVVTQGSNLPITGKKGTKKRSLPPLLKKLRPDWEWNPQTRRWYDYNVVDLGLEKLRKEGIDVNVTWRNFSSTDKAKAETTFHSHLTGLFGYILMYFLSNNVAVF